MKRICIPLAMLLAVACHDEPSQSVSNTKTDSSFVTVVPSADKTGGSEKFNGPVISERIDGPANIRSAANGKMLYNLEHNVAITASEPENGWMEIGVWIDLENPEQQLIKKGSTLYRDGKPIGKALEDVRLYQTYTKDDRKRGVLNGFTAVNNIQSATIPENAFTALATNKASLTLAEMKPFLESYQFEDFSGLTDGYKGYVFYERDLLDPTAAPRFWPVFDDNELVLVFHGRKMEIPGVSTEAFQGGYVTVLSKDTAKVESLKKKFIAFIQSAG